jgi:hypothetical protein
MGIVRVGIVASKDHPGQGAIGFYLEPTANGANSAAIPAFIGNEPTVVIPSNGPPNALSGEAAASPVASQPRSASLNQALAVKQKFSAALLRSNPAIFGVGVGQSLDNPNDAALILFVDRKKIVGDLPESSESIGGIRVRFVLMDRLHVTRSHGLAPGATTRSTGACLSSRRSEAAAGGELDLVEPKPDVRLFEDRIPLPE